MLGANRCNEIRQIVIEPTDVVDVAAPTGTAVAAQIGGVDRHTLSPQRLGQRIHDAAFRARAVNKHRDLFSAAGIGAIGEFCAIPRCGSALEDPSDRAAAAAQEAALPCECDCGRQRHP
jgi:hypothetical protein